MAEKGDDRYLPGTLNPSAIQSPGDYKETVGPSMDNNNFFTKFHETMQKGASLNTFKGVNRYKAMVISEVKTTKSGGFLGCGGKERYEFRIRIPELHSGIQDPCALPPDGGGGANFNDKVKKLVGMHPMAYSASDKEGGDGNLPEPKMGDIVWVEFEKGPSAGKMSAPIYVGRFSKGKGTNNISEVCDGLAESMNAAGNRSTVGGNHANVGGYGGDPSSWPVSDSSEHIEGEAASGLHDVARAYYEELGYTWYDDPFMLNLMGIRNTNTRSNNSFDDKIICMYTDDAGTQHVYVWPGTTRPGRPAMMDGRTGGIAIMTPSAPQYHADFPTSHGAYPGRTASAGQKTYYKGAPSDGKVRGRNSDSGTGFAGDGPDPVQAYRDTNNDDVFDYDPNSIKGCAQCQIHGTGPHMGDGVAANVGGLRADGSAWAWSEGCQVWGSWADYTFWLSLWSQQIQNGREYIDYVLIRAEDSPELWGTQTESGAPSDEPQAGDPIE